jgi:hypothetical protein
MPMMKLIKNKRNALVMTAFSTSIFAQQQEQQPQHQKFITQ